MAAKTKAEHPRRKILYPVLQNGAVGYIDREGRMIVSPQFNGVSDDSFRVIGAVTVRGFRTGLAPAQIGEKWGYIDADGRVAINPDFEEAGVFENGLAPVS